MRILILGNTAQNGWLLAKLLRTRGMETSLLHQGYASPVHSPWWEDGGDPDWKCPSWAFTAGQGRVAAADYDLAILVGGWVGAGPQLQGVVPYIVLDCGLLRVLTQNPYDAERRLSDHEAQRAMAGYAGARHVALTNADTEPAARMLGLQGYSFLPHPVDTDRFSDGPRTLQEHHLRERWLAGADLLFFSPTRHDDAEKATGVTVRAFAHYARAAAERAVPPARLVLVNHGADVVAAAKVCTQPSTARRVTWLPPLPKWQLAQAYRAADVVLDQFSPGVGAFGTIAVEALACGRPLVTHLDPAAHAWCADVLPVPPVCLAATVDAATQHLIGLASNPRERRRIGARGRAWVEEWHTSERVAGLWADLCQRVLEKEVVAPCAA